jgi:uncharacterized protein YcgI (DUF1989 family)
MTADVVRPRRQCVVEGGGGGSVVLRAGQCVQIVNTLGYQVVDTWALTLDGDAALSMSHSRLAMARLNPRVGDTMVDDLRRPMLTLAEDDSGGVHDTLIAACDPERYRALGFHGWHASCSDNFRQVVAKVRGSGWATRRPVPDPLNLFMAVETSQSGELSLRESVAAPGSRVILRAHQDLRIVVSACPQDLVPISGSEGPPRRVDLYVDDEAAEGERR